MVYIPFNGSKFQLKSLTMSLQIEGKCSIELVNCKDLLYKVELPDVGLITLEWDSFENVPTTLSTIELKCKSIEPEKICNLFALEIDISSK